MKINRSKTKQNNSSLFFHLVFIFTKSKGKFMFFTKNQSVSYLTKRSLKILKRDFSVTDFLFTTTEKEDRGVN